MTFALPMLIGGALFLALMHFVGPSATIALGLILLVVELAHDMRLYRQPARDRGVER